MSGAPRDSSPNAEVAVVVDGSREGRVPPGVTVAAALLNSGVRAFRRSAVRDEPRGPLCGMGVCYECRVCVDGVAQRRACMIQVADGQRVTTDAGEGSGEWGVTTPGRPGAVHSRLPTPHSPLPTFDLAVVGAGPAGIAAAATAAESGRRVVLIDENPDVGGQIWRHRSRREIPRAARRWLARLERSGATVLRGVSVVDVHGDAQDGFVVAAERDGAPLVVGAGALVLATGARERFLPFPGWTLPGVVGVGGAQALLKAGASFARKRVVIAGSGPLLLPVAASLAAHGARVVLVAEQAPRGAVMRFALGLWRKPTALLEAARYRAGFARTPYETGLWVAAARGDGRVERVELTDGRGATRTLACDVLCTAHGLVPNTELARLLGCATAPSGGVTVDERQRTTRAGVFCAGEPTGVGGVELAVAEGEIAGLAAAGRDAAARRRAERLTTLRRAAAAMEHAFAPRAELRDVVTPETIACRCEDVTLGEIAPDWAPRQAKLYTRVGMGACQGRVCGAALEFLYGWPAHDTAVRAPTEPALLSTLLADAATSAVTAAPPEPQHGA